MNPDYKNLTKIPYFRRVVLQNFPFIEEDFDALTDYGLLCKVVEYLNKVIEQQNLVNDNTNSLYQSYIQLKNFVDNYFNNLDVQEEINNKLDAMAQDGTLQEIIADYLNSKAVFGFDTVESMKQSTNLINGSYAQTLGFYEKNDGGNALYKIRNITNNDVVDNMFIIALNNENLIAELIFNENNTINVKQLGAKGDGITDDTNSFISALNVSENKKLFIPNGTYLITNSLTILTGTNIYGEGYGSIIKYNGVSTEDYLIYIPISSRFVNIDSIYIDGNYLINGIYDGLNPQSNAQTRFKLTNTKIYKCKTALYLNSIGSDIEGCYIFGEYTLDNSGRCSTGIYINSTDNKIYNNRIACFNNYGVYCNNSSNTLINVKCSLNNKGFYFKGDNLFAEIESQENFENNIELYRVYGSNFNINSGGAGIVSKEDYPTIPDILNDYSLIDISESNSTIINGSLLSRQSYGDTWSCEGNIIKLRKCIGLDINMSSYSGNETSVMPQLINADTITGNNIKINSCEITNSLRKRNVNISGTSNVALNYQDDDVYNITINPTANGTVAFVSFPYTECNYISIFNKIGELIKLSRIYFRYTINGTNKTISLTDNTRQLNTSNSAMYRMIENISETLANNSTYQTDLNSGDTITDKRIFIDAQLTNYSGNRENINCLLEVYYD